MTTNEAKAAFLEGVPVIHNGIEYLHISALIYRRHKGAAILQLEMMDKSGHSVTVASPAKVERKEAAQ